jgi:hypothetical protein
VLGCILQWLQLILLRELTLSSAQLSIVTLLDYYFGLYYTQATADPTKKTHSVLCAMVDKVTDILCAGEALIDGVLNRDVLIFWIVLYTGYSRSY